MKGVKDVSKQSPVNTALSLRLLHAVVVLHRTARTHALSNDAGQAPLLALVEVLNALLKENDTCEFMLSGSVCVANGAFVAPELNQLPSLREVAQDLRSRDVGGFRVFRTVNSAMVINLITAVLGGAIGPSMSGDYEVLSAGPIDRMLRQLHANEVAKIAARDSTKRALQLYAALISIVERSIDAARAGTTLGIGIATARVLRELVDSGLKVPHILLTLALLRDDRLPYLARHLASTTILCVLVGIELRQPRGELMHIANVALLHEVGMAVHGAHLEGEGITLSAADHQLIRDLPLLSARLFLRRSGLDQQSLRAMLATVEIRRPFDQPVGGLPASDTPESKQQRTMLSARIVQACSSFDALTSNRPFRAAFSIPDALAKIHSGDSRIDPRIMKVLTAVVIDPRSLIGRPLQKAPLGRIKLTRRAVPRPEA